MRHCIHLVIEAKMFKKIFFIIIQFCSDIFLLSNFVEFSFFLIPFFCCFENFLVSKVLFFEPFKKTLLIKGTRKKFADQ